MRGRVWVWVVLVWGVGGVEVEGWRRGGGQRVGWWGWTWRVFGEMRRGCGGVDLVGAVLIAALGA